MTDFCKSATIVKLDTSHFLYVYMYVCRPHFGDHGGIDIKIRDAAIQLHFLITKSADGHPVILSTECDVILPSLSVDLCGSTRFICNMLSLILMYSYIKLHTVG